MEKRIHESSEAELAVLYRHKEPPDRRPRIPLDTPKVRLRLPSRLGGQSAITPSQYLQLDETFWSIQQNVFMLAWRLYLTQHRRLRRLGFGKRGLIGLLFHRFRARPGQEILELPVGGELCLETHNAHLVFDLRRRQVIKVFAPGVALEAMEREIRNIEWAQKLGFAPLLLGWDLEQRWYAMECVCGRSGWSIAPSDPAEFQRQYHRYVETCIEGLITSEPSVRVSLGTYLQQTLDSLQLLDQSDLDGKTVQGVHEFVGHCEQQLRGYEDHQLHLAMSHGDFLNLNMIKKKEELTVVDWENAARRSLLHDFYNYYFSHMYWNVPAILHEKVASAIESLRQNLAPGYPELANTLRSERDIYKYIYYLERICMLIERKSRSDESRMIILRTLDVFSRFESNKGYSDFFGTDVNVENYERVTYSPQSYDTYLWGLEKAQVVEALEEFRQRNGRCRHLDFACGTGRILAAARGITDESVGLDISDKMLSVAGERVPGVELKHGDIVSNPEIAGGAYDIITAFRFFRNAEPKLQQPIMSALASRLRDPCARLIFNVHWMPRGASWKRLVKGSLSRRASDPTPSLSLSETRRLVTNAGMEIESWHSFGVCPVWMSRSRFRAVASFVDRIVGTIPVIKMIPQNRVFVCRMKRHEGSAA